VKLSYFLLALSQNLISEVTLPSILSQVIVVGNTLFFKGVNNSAFFSSNWELLKKDRLLTLLLYYYQFLR